jgi:hypothetical protein
VAKALSPSLPALPATKLLDALSMLAEIEDEKEIEMWASRKLEDYVPTCRILIHLCRMSLVYRNVLRGDAARRID